jgi:hypothetical protein
MSEEDDLLSLVDQRLADWLYRCRQWYALYYVFNGLAVVLTITVAARPSFMPPNSDLFGVAAWLAAVSQGFSTFLTALPKATSYRAAWRALWLARLEYLDSNKSEDSTNLLKQSIARGWIMIDGGYGDASSATSRAGRRK